MRDTGNQVVLGTFIATFIYCLLILRTVKGAEGVVFVPSISVTVGVLLAIASLAVLIYFINHIALSIQASRVIATIGADLTQSIDRLYPERLDENVSGEMAEDGEWRADGEPTRIYASRSGYVQRVQYCDLASLAEEAGVVLRVPHPPGQFIAAGSMLAEVFGEPAPVCNDAGEDEFEKRVLDAFWLGNDRAAGRDIEFYIDQLVEIAVRALSPGVNDPFTAMQCLDQLGASLRQLAERRLPSPLHRDEAGAVRVVTRTQTLEGALGAAFNLIRQFGSSSPPVMMRLMETLAVLAEYAPSSEHQQALLMHARMTENACSEHLKERVDIDALEERFTAVIEALEREQPTPQAS